MKTPDNINGPCVIMIGFTSYQLCFLKPRRITMFELIPLFIIKNNVDSKHLFRVLYKLLTGQPSSILTHSFVIDPLDETLAAQDVFTESELKEIISRAMINFPDVEDEPIKYIYKFKQTSTTDLRKSLFDYEWYQEYDEKKHASLDWIRRSIDTILPLYEKKLFEGKHSEQWYQKRVWCMIDSLFEIVPDLVAIRGENCSSASSDRKNIDREASSVEKLGAKKMGRREDLIIRYQATELGCGEDKAVDSGTNMMQDRGIKCPKMMRDMLWALMKKVNFDQEKSKKVAVLGVTTFGLDLYVDWMTIHEGYISVLVRSKEMTTPSSIPTFLNALPILVRLLSALEVVESVINVISVKDDCDLETLKKSLKRAYNDPDDEDDSTKEWSRIVSATTPENKGRFRSVFGV